MKNNKSTNLELVNELRLRDNNTGKYTALITNALMNKYHDFKNPEDVVCGKMELIADLYEFPELEDIAADVKDGVYDESPDEEDREEMKSWLPKELWKSLGLE